MDDAKIMIKIIDNFFDEKLFKNINSHVLHNIYYTPRWLEGKEKTKENYYGDRFVLADDPKLTKVFIENVENKFKIKIKKLHNDSGIDLRNISHFIPHDDVPISKLNVLIMISGPTAVTNGTVFYTKGELDIHVGFRENRAVLFPSSWIHSPHKSEVVNLKRYTASLFIADYEE